jgi:ABC-type cobalamin/Fe3+-siderophores transport system ATPase subunit
MSDSTAANVIVEEQGSATSQITFQTVTRQVAENLTITVKGGTPLFILGRNGTGKSALVQHLVSILGTKVVYVPGSRPSYFDHEALSMTPASRKQYGMNSVNWDRSPDSRWHAISGTQRNEKAIHDLQVREAQYKIDAANAIQREGTNSPAIALLQAANSPLDQVNLLLGQAGLPVTLVFDEDIKASRAGSVYSLARMSDGERTAVILAAEVVSAPSQTIFLVDEPELHLHRAIVIPLLAALINKRRDCGFVVSTHELELPRAIHKGALLLVRNVTWVNQTASSWDADTLTSVESIPESLYVDILGSRSRMLFVEGSNESLDTPLYSLLFPDISIAHRGGCRQVREAVVGVRSINEMHRVQVFGLVDNDGMDSVQVADLESKGIYPLSVFSVESIYYSHEVLSAVAVAQSKIMGGRPEDYLGAATMDALRCLENSGVVEHLASRRAERLVHDRALAELPERRELAKLGSGEIVIKIPSPYAAELGRLRHLISSKSLQEIIERYPVRESGVLNALAHGLRFQSRADYEAAALNCIATSEYLKKKVQSKLGNLSVQLMG